MTYTDENRQRIIDVMTEMQVPHYDIADVKSGKLCMYKAANHYEIPRYMPVTQFTTDDGRVIAGQQFQNAINYVADAWALNACKMRISDNYASHVTEMRKDEILNRSLRYAENIRKGHLESPIIRQKMQSYFNKKR